MIRHRAAGVTSGFSGVVQIPRGASTAGDWRCAPRKSPGTTKVDVLVEWFRSSVGRVSRPIGSYTSLIERKRIDADAWADAGCDMGRECGSANADIVYFCIPISSNHETHKRRTITFSSDIQELRLDAWYHVVSGNLQRFPTAKLTTISRTVLCRFARVCTVLSPTESRKGLTGT